MIAGRLNVATPRAPLFVFGYPSALGGADTELWHVLKLWRRRGLVVRLVPTWRTPPEWRERCDAIGAETWEIEGPELLGEVPGLAGSTVVSFCNGEFLQHAGKLRELGCRLVWANCMTWISLAEEIHCERYGPFDAYVFQSEFQRECLMPTLRPFGVTDQQCHLIRGAFDTEEFPYRPKTYRTGDEFVVGRISRPDPTKFHPDTWALFEAIPYRPLKVRVLGWSREVEQKLGPPPSWAEVLPAGAESARDFLNTLHCLAQINGGSRENWPRVGLEALASGVPLVVEDAWGWREMIRPGLDGLAARQACEVSDLIGRLACEPSLAAGLAVRGRERLVELADPDEVWSRWSAALFEAC